MYTEPNDTRHHHTCSSRSHINAATLMGRNKQHPSSGSEPLHKVAKKPGAGKRLSSQAKFVVHHVRQFFEEERLRSRRILPNKVVERTAKATGVSVRSVISIGREYIDNSGHFLTPTKRYVTSRVRVTLMPLTRQQFEAWSMISISENSIQLWTRFFIAYEKRGCFRVVDGACGSSSTAWDSPTQNAMR